MISKSIPLSWLVEEGRRLDCGPFVKGSIEARKKIESLDIDKTRLRCVTKNGKEGIYHVGQEKLKWVYASEYGYRFLRSAGILKLGFDNEPLVSREQIDANPLFRCPKGTTLITRSGTIGRMAYCNEHMADMAMSQDVLKVVPDEEKISAGYLYSFLKSCYGLPIVVGGTFGSIIVHIEAENISEMSIPRFGHEKEKEVGDKVDRAAANRCRAFELLEGAQKLIHQNIGLSSRNSGFSIFSETSSSKLQVRMDAYYFNEKNRYSRKEFDGTPFELKSLGSICNVFIPKIFKRKYVEDPSFGVPYLTGADVFSSRPEAEKYLMRSVAEDLKLVLKKGMIAIQEAGQLGGLIGRSVYVGDYLNGFACSNNMIRLVPENEIDSGYIFALLSTNHGVNLISREAAGSSIPHIEENRVKNIEIPWPSKNVRAGIAQLVIEAMKLRDEAFALETKAIIDVESLIQEY